MVDTWILGWIGGTTFLAAVQLVAMRLELKRIAESLRTPRNESKADQPPA